MRFMIPIAALLLPSFHPQPAPAQTMAVQTTPAQATPAPTVPILPAPPQIVPAPAPSAAQTNATGTPSATPSTTTPPARTRRVYASRQTLAQRFDHANTSKDGHLTKDQAGAARWSYITRNFDGIDKDHKGFVTVDDIRGYARDRRAARLLQQRETTAATHS